MTKFKTKPLIEVNDGDLFLVDLETVSMHMRNDYYKRNLVVAAGKPLCDNCDGTGNEFYSMYRKCPVCGGDGIKMELSDEHHNH
jgi:rubredoxin